MAKKRSVKVYGTEWAVSLMRQSILPRYIKSARKNIIRHEGDYCRIEGIYCRISVKKCRNGGFWRCLQSLQALEIPMLCCYIEFAPGEDVIDV